MTRLMENMNIRFGKISYGVVFMTTGANVSLGLIEDFSAIDATCFIHSKVLG
jgi:hypothetical protein